MRFLVFGAINIDLVFSVDHIVLPGETIHSGAVKRSAGGKGANQAAALAKAGVPVCIAGKIGGDGAFLLDLLRGYGVDTRYVMDWEGATGQALIQVDKSGQNSIILHAGGNGAIREGEIGPVLDNFRREDMVLLQNEIPLTGKIMEEAKRRGMRICLNPSPFDGEGEKLPLGMADILFVNRIEGAALAGLDPESPPPVILERLASRLPGTEITLTAGKEGAWYGYGAARARGESVEVSVADTTGAGDTFTGYFLAARACGRNVEDALALACRAASIAVSRPGAMEAIPLGTEVYGGKNRRTP